MISEIKQIPIQGLLDTLGVKYTRSGNTLDLFDNGKKTDGWRASLSQNIVTAFSKERPQGNPLDFYMRFTNCPIGEAIKFFEERYHIAPQKEYKPYLKRPLQNQKPEVFDYLKKRGIDPEKVKAKIEYGTHNIARLGADKMYQVVKIYMKDLITGEIVGDNKRAIGEDKIFDTEGNDGFFYSNLPEIKKSISITEGMFDYLTVAQYSENVIGMKSCDRNWTQDEIDFLNSFERVNVLLDNDDAGRKGVKKINDILSTNVFVMNFIDGEKDINEAKNRREDNTFLAYVKDNLIPSKVKPFSHITYAEKIDRAISELFATNPTDVIKWGWKEWDDLFGGIYGGKIYTIGANSGTGKTTFVNQICDNIQKQGVRVVKYGLEDRMEDIGKEEIYYFINRRRAVLGLTKYQWTLFLNNEYGTHGSKYFDPDFKNFVEEARKHFSQYSILELDKEKQATVEDLCKLMEEECRNGTKVFAIDHLHYFKMKNGERTDLEIQGIMHQINEVARKNNVTVFLIAHYSNLHGKEPDNDSFKDASAIKQVSNVIIHIIRADDGNTIFRIGKLRSPIKPREIWAEFDIDTYRYKFFDEGFTDKRSRNL